MSALLVDRALLLEPLNLLAATGGRYALLGDYPELPDRFEGRDIDLVVNCIDLALQTFSRAQWVLRRPERYRLQAFLLPEEGARWVTVDMIQPQTVAEPTILENLLDAASADPSGLYRVPSAYLLAWKTVKRLEYGTFHKPEQLSEIATWWKQADAAEVSLCGRLLHQQGLAPAMQSLLRWTSDGGLTADDFASHAQYLLAPKRRLRERSRTVRDGSIKIRGLTRHPQTLIRWLRAVVRPDPRPLISVALVGNDGSGKSMIVSRLKREIVLKTDPIHIVMRRDDPLIPAWRRLRPKIRSVSRSIDARTGLAVCRFLMRWVTEFADYLDRRVRYTLGHNWARAGLGLVLFERYPTDRTRGEFDRSRRHLHPLEQFFPMPDLVVLLDVSAETSLKRKPNDGHTLEEMNAKRRNYLRLASEITPHVVIDGSLPAEDILREISTQVWHHCHQRQYGNGKDYPGKWIPEKATPAKTGLFEPLNRRSLYP